MSARDSEYEARRETALWDLPWPARPGTFWNPNTGPWAASYCLNCRREYNAHGGIAGFPRDRQLGTGGETEIDRERQLREMGRLHLTCPAPDLEWGKFRDAQRRRSVDLLSEYLVQQLASLSAADRRIVLDRLTHAFSGEDNR